MRKFLLGTASAVTIGVAGFGLIQASEGRVLVSYQDQAGVWTIGYGHTGPEVGPGQRITEAEANRLLREDIRIHQNGVKACTFQPLNQNQLDAVTSFTFNAGVRGYCKSTMARMINYGDYKGASAEFPKWNKITVNGKKYVNRGLTKRRGCERMLFDSPVAVNSSSEYALKEIIVKCALK